MEVQIVDAAQLPGRPSQGAVGAVQGKLDHHARVPALFRPAQREGVASGERIDIATEGIAEVEFGGLVGRGRLLAADSIGRAVMLDPEGTFMTIVAGAAAATNIAVSGIKSTDALINVIATDRTDVGDITVTDGNIQCSNSTASKNLIVAWRRHQHYIGLALEDGGPGDIGSVILAPGAS